MYIFEALLYCRLKLLQLILMVLIFIYYSGRRGIDAISIDWTSIRKAQAAIALKLKPLKDIDN